MAGKRFPARDAADDPQRQSQHLPTLGASHLKAPTPEGLCPWVSTEVLVPLFKAFLGLARADVTSLFLLVFAFRSVLRANKLVDGDHQGTDPIWCLGWDGVNPDCIFG